MSTNANLGLVKQILENIRFPERLNAHPWVNFRFVQEAVKESPELTQKEPGYRLVAAVSLQFIKMMPNTPPKQGKRLDTRWGKFGILAAQYFAPLRYGEVAPSSLQDAWGAIDSAILRFVFDKPANLLPDADVSLYKLVGDELGVAARSTISDWHINGCQQLADLILNYERHLDSTTSSAGSTLSEPAFPGLNTSSIRRPLRWLYWFAALLFSALLLITVVKIWKAYQIYATIRVEVSQLQDLVSPEPSIEHIQQAGDILGKLRQDVVQLNDEVAAPLRFVGPWLAWLPGYGPDLASAGDLLQIADKTTASAQILYQAVSPLYLQFQMEHQTVADVTKGLLKVHPQLLEAQVQLSQAQAARSRLDVAKLSTRAQALVQDVDLVLGIMDDSLLVGLSIPKLLGASSDGPKTYMLLVQNEDELRPTGGFIGVVGSFVVRDGQPMGFSFKDSYAFDDWTKPYPEAPWQLEAYMNIPALVLRDANWYTSFPAAVSWIEYLYAYSDDHSVDGVIAIDQQSLVYLLQAIGPVTVKGVSKQVTSANIIEFMRDAKAPPAFESDASKWELEHRKDFIQPLADSILEKLLSGKGVVWDKVIRLLARSLNERHILLQFDDPLITQVISKYEWDGALNPKLGDFLMVVDSNVGINKANANMESSLAYAVDLTDLMKPVGSLVVFHKNNSSKSATCSTLGAGDRKTYPFYGMDRCYRNYMRVYVPKGTSLLEATPHENSSRGAVFPISVPARVDTLDMGLEEIDNASGYGTLLSVPGSETLSTSFKFLLPSNIVSSQENSKQKTYTLKIQKQPGSQSPIVTIRIHLPANARVDKAPLGTIVNGEDILIETNLLTDIHVLVVFSLP